jgi:hypothetical protein
MIKRPAETMRYLTVKLRKELAQEIDAFLDDGDGSREKPLAAERERSFYSAHPSIQ